MRPLRMALVVSVAALGLPLACGLGDFDPQSKLASVRILASKADKPYAKPGESVHLEVLAVDERPDRSRPMTLYWIPVVCKNPVNDAYYGCFAPPRADAGADGSSGAGGAGNLANLLRPGIDLTPFLRTGNSYDFTMPADAVTSHKSVAGVDVPYGLAILFNVACAGHLETVEVDPAAGLQQVPIACFDQAGNQLGPSEYVIGFTRVYAYDSRTNQNPVIQSVTFDGAPIDLSKGVDLDRCTTALRRDCPERKFDVVVPSTSWELHPGDTDENGGVRHEQIWVTYFSDIGQLESDARLLYDPVQGKVDGSEVKYQPPSDAREGTLFVVVHDNRGGAEWASIPLRVH